MLHSDAYHKKTFAGGVAQRGNRSTLTTGTVTIKHGVQYMHAQLKIIAVSLVD